MEEYVGLSRAGIRILLHVRNQRNTLIFQTKIPQYRFPVRFLYRQHSRHLPEPYCHQQLCIPCSSLRVLRHSRTDELYLSILSEKIVRRYSNQGIIVTWRQNWTNNFLVTCCSLRSFFGVETITEFTNL